MRATTKRLASMAKANKGASPWARKTMASAKRRVMARVGKKTYRQGLISGYGHKD